MSDPTTLRINSTDDPARLEKFETDLATNACDKNEVIRKLVDVWRRYVREHGHAPSFPARLVPDKEATTKRKKK